MYSEKTITILSEPGSGISWWSATGGFYQYFYKDIFKFNIATKQNIGIYNDSVINGESLESFYILIKEGLIDLIKNYHNEITEFKTPKQSAKREILGEEIMLNIFDNQVDRLIDNIRITFEKVSNAYENSGNFIAYGNGHLDNFDSKVLSSITWLYSKVDLKPLDFKTLINYIRKDMKKAKTHFKKTSISKSLDNLINYGYLLKEGYFTLTKKGILTHGFGYPNLVESIKPTANKG